ncbi:MAG TPA: DMT family transporter, partial [Actinoplanes sp.]
MTQLANDTRATTVRSSRRVGGGVLLAVISATSFGMSGSLARGLMSVGWSPGAIVLARMGIAALVLAPFAVAALRGRWGALRGQIPQILVYGLVAVAGAQFCYFSAVASMDVAPALLIEYTAPAAVVAWLWIRHGQRPRPLTIAGAGVAALGLVLVL